MRGMLKIFGFVGEEGVAALEGGVGVALWRLS